MFGGATACVSKSGLDSTRERWWSGLFGSDLRMDYTAVGQTTHLAARMEQMATPGTNLTGGSTTMLRLALTSLISMALVAPVVFPTERG